MEYTTGSTTKWEVGIEQRRYDDYIFSIVKKINNIFVAEEMTYSEGFIVLLGLAQDTFSDESDILLCDPRSWSKEDEYHDELRESNDWQFLEIMMEKVNDIFVDEKLTNGDVFGVFSDLFNIIFDKVKDSPEADVVAADLASKGFNIW